MNSLNVFACVIVLVRPLLRALHQVGRDPGPISAEAPAAVMLAAWDTTQRSLAAAADVGLHSGRPHALHRASE